MGLSTPVPEQAVALEKCSSSDLEFSVCTISTCMMDVERVNPLKHEVRLNNRLYLKSFPA